MEPLTLTVNDTCRALRLGRSTIYCLIGRGRLDTVKVGKRTLVKAASVRALVGGEVGA